MRGTHIHCRRIGWATGIIPAYAGNTSRTVSPVLSPRDHPRVCGEHASASSGLIAVMGSSPRMRGTRLRAGDDRLLAGIIPAYAGNTWTLSTLHAHHWDHPRVCGEHRTLSCGKCRFWGSSPRMRGTRFIQMFIELFGGIIPAYAGNTILSPLLVSSSRDHPRVCGEHR